MTTLSNRYINDRFATKGKSDLMGRGRQRAED